MSHCPSLADLALLEDDLREAVQAGYESARITEYTPPVAEGMILWSALNSAVREKFVPEGWAMQHDLNYATTIHPLGHTAIAVAAGNKYTGQPDKPANTQTAKGPATWKVVNSNQLGFRDVDEVAWDPAAEEQDHESNCLTWLLLHYREPNSGAVMLELSLPMHMREGRVTEWRYRIMLRPVFPTDSSIWGLPSAIDLSDLIKRKEEEREDDDRAVQSG